jgi:hypothetical protein
MKEEYNIYKSGDYYEVMLKKMESGEWYNEDSIRELEVLLQREKANKRNNKIDQILA